MQKNYLQKSILRFLALAITFLNISSIEASSFPFREIAPGVAVPDVTLLSLEGSTEKIQFSGLKGTPFVVVFWGADLPEKIEYSAKVLREVEELSSFFDARNIKRFSVNVQKDDSKAIAEVVSTSTTSLVTYSDENNSAYGALGIYVMPAVLLIDKDGIIAAGMGYSRDVVDRLKGSVEIMLGEKTPEQVAAELRPEMKEASDIDKAGRRHLNFGKVMMKRGLFDAAIREFAKAIEIKPDMVDARLLLGCLYLDKMDITHAEIEINKVLAAEPESIPGKTCMGELLRLKKQVAEASQILQDVINADPKNFKAKYYFARVLEDQDKKREAMNSYKQAYTDIVRNSVKGE